MWTDPNNILAIINILVMGLLTFFVAKATKSAADTADATYKLNERLVTIEETEKQSLKEIYLGKTIVELQKIVSVVNNQSKSLNTSLMKSVLKPKLLSEEQLAKYFTTAERNIIEYPFSIYEEYLEEFWLTETGEFEGVFPGNKHIEVQEASVEISEILQEGLEKIYRIN